MNENNPHKTNTKNGRLAVTTLTALGVVYGDIGTSPLYALRECFHGPAAVELTTANVLGVLSLVVWSLVIVISVKYLMLVMRADNHGEGGILALMALAVPDSGKQNSRGLLLLMGLFGAGLLLGDGMITPAISVLSAVEGLHVATPAFDMYVMPITIGILIGLFAIQYHGTARVGTLFGPVMLVWFATLSALGVAAIVQQPQVLVAVSPHYAVEFFVYNRWAGFVIMGLVFLVVTGGEALYADMGHFGARPIRLAWFGLVLPALLINYFGQGALLVGDPAAKINPFYHLAPDWAQLPLVGLATAATVIASQAVITGAFSLAQQAVQLGYSPRLNIIHTSDEEHGQIYVPVLNWILLVAVIGLVATFESSSNLAAAYGMAVTSTMVITTVLLYVVAREHWGWPRVAAIPLAGFFLIIDLAFFSANLTKILAGGWFPILIGAAAGMLMITWQQGRQVLQKRFRAHMVTTEELLEQIEREPPVRVSGCSVYLSGYPEGIPLALQHNLKHNKVLHEKVALLTIVVERSPQVRSEQRLELTPLGQGLYRLVARYGYMQHANVPRILNMCETRGVPFPREETTFFLGRETLEVGREHGMARWRKSLFVWMSRNAHDASLHFGVPPDRVVEIGVQLEI